MRSFFVEWIPLAAFRLLSVLLVQTWFVPDEPYQSLEVAHRAVFGKGHLTWEWTHALRSPIHPAMCAIIYKLMMYFGFTEFPAFVLIPRAFHALLFSLGDISFLRLCRRVLMNRTDAHYAFITYLSSWFVFYCASRTLSNSLETALTLIALNWYPVTRTGYRPTTGWPYIVIGVVTIIIRPTAALLWFVLGMNHLLSNPSPARLLINTAVPVTLSVLMLSMYLDYTAYGRLTSSLWNFLKFNVLQGGSAHFGVHPWRWYFIYGIPSVLPVQLIPLLYMLLSERRPTLVFFYAACLYVIVHSALPHKEHRFLLPVIPFLCIYAGAFFDVPRWKPFHRIVFGAMIGLNIVIAGYTGLRHQVGPYAALDSVMKSKGEIRLASLMPCYSIPAHSYMHDRATVIRQLDCTPDLSGNQLMDESDEFHLEPEKWLDQHRMEMDDMTHLILFEKSYTPVSETLTKLGFGVCDRVFHADFLTSSSHDHYITVLCREKKSI